MQDSQSDQTADQTNKQSIKKYYYFQKKPWRKYRKRQQNIFW